MEHRRLGPSDQVLKVWGVQTMEQQLKKVCLSATGFLKRNKVILFTHCGLNNIPLFLEKQPYIRDDMGELLAVSPYESSV